jgi:hypothetical protein
MTRGRNLITTILLAATIIFMSSRACEAQEQSPSPRMLLNLDLFTAQPGGHQPGPAGDDNGSTLEQLRALRSMGYLSGDGPLPDADDPDEPPDDPARGRQPNEGAQR